MNPESIIKLHELIKSIFNGVSIERLKELIEILFGDLV